MGRLLLSAALLCLSACASLSSVQREQALDIAAQARPLQLTCDQPGHCAQPSPLRDLAGKAFADSTDARPRHEVVVLDKGTDAMLARINLIRSATTSIELQTYIYDEDDAGLLVLDELLAAARRGVRVRLLIDQLAAFNRLETITALVGAHANFRLRLYNPMLHRAQISYPQYLLSAACCWTRLNQRMHTKLLLVDAAVGISGGRNYQNDYYDWDPEFNFRDRDVLIAGPAARTMLADFELFWNDRRSVPPERLTDVGRRLLSGGVPELPTFKFERPARVQAMRDAAADAAQVQSRLVDRSLSVGKVSYVADSPAKHREGNDGVAAATAELRALIESAQDEVLLQTPYLVLSDSAQQMFRQLHDRPDAPRIVVSTNSLASTDAFIAYALSYKYKRRYLREFGFNIYEYKPFPLDAPVDIDATGAPPPRMELPGGEVVGGEAVASMSASDRRQLKDDYDQRSVVGRARYREALSREYAALRYGSRRSNQPVPLESAGVRVSLHAKSLVIDGRIGVIGTHNFDPRGDHYNTEGTVVIEDETFARQLAASIRRDIAPENAWVIAPRDKAPILWGLEYSLAKASEYLPVFDLWPVRYATSYEYQPGPACPAPLAPDDPGFRACYRPVGDFPEVNLGLKGLSTRLLTAFGAGLAPIL